MISFTRFSACITVESISGSNPRDSILYTRSRHEIAARFFGKRAKEKKIKKKRELDETRTPLTRSANACQKLSAASRHVSRSGTLQKPGHSWYDCHVKFWHDRKVNRLFPLYFHCTRCLLGKKKKKRKIRRNNIDRSINNIIESFVYDKSIFQIICLESLRSV